MRRSQRSPRARRLCDRAEGACTSGPPPGIELGIILAVLIGWQFTLAEFVGGPLMIVFLAVVFRLFLRTRLVAAARDQANKGVAGRMEGHADMDMSVTEGSIWSRIRSPRGFTSISHYFVMDWASIWTDIAVGLLIAGALAAWVPNSFWRDFFLVDHDFLAKLWGPLIGPVVSMLSFVCSIGNVPLAAVLWNGGISFGGVVAFIFADLIVLPILNIYRKIRHRDPLRCPWTDSRRAKRQGRRGVGDAQLHDRAQRHVLGARRCAGREVPS